MSTEEIAHHIAALQQAESPDRDAAARFVLRLDAARDTAHVRASVGRLVARHDALRSRVVPAPAGYGVVNAVHAPAALQWQEPDGPAGGATATLPGLPLRVEHRPGGDGAPAELALSLSARTVDAAGLAALGAELLDLLEGAEPAEPVQIGQYAAWQQQMRTQEPEGSATSLALAPGLKSPRLGQDAYTDGPAAEADEDGGRVELAVDDALRARIADLAAKLDTDAGTVVLAAWLVVLWRHNADRDFQCGVHVDHRRRYPDLATTAGLLSWHLPLAAGLGEEETGRELVERLAVQRAGLLALTDHFSWDDVPRGTADCDAREPRRPVLFTDLALGSDAAVEALADLDAAQPLAFGLEVLRGPGSLRLTLRHDSAAGRATAESLGASLGVLLDGLTADPDRPVAELALLTVAGTGDVLAGFGHAPEETPYEAGHVYELFARQAARTPDRLAVHAAGHGFTYAELDARAAVVADGLRRQGLGPGARVGLLVERSAEMVAVVLGVWRAGMAYVPLDPATPADRIGFILGDSGSALLVTDLPERPAGELPVPVITVADLLDGAAPAAGPEEVERGVSDLAYVIYTSGTTGRPKGVQIEHRSAVYLARAHRERIYRRHDPEGAGLRAGFTASLAFDGSVERILTLLYGCTLYLYDDASRQDPGLFLEFAERHRLQVLDVTPSFLALLVQRGLLDSTGYRPELVLVGGEAIPESLWPRLAESGPAFYNVYGPTEATVNAAVGEVRGERPHLGPALPGARLYVLDAQDRPVPPGVVGEIHISGVGLARGYLGRDDLTAAAFVPNPFAAGDPLHARMYRTGDRGRFRPDGAIEFLGRADGQVKLRGFRIELGEISAVLREDPAVEDALAVLHKPESGDPSLVGYAVTAGPVDEVHARLRERLAARLPEYMRPAELVLVPEWPRTVNGKVDTAALPAPGTARQTTLSAAYVAPSGELEIALAEIWSTVLGRTGIGARDNFFELGGHSLLAARMIAAVNEEFGLDLPLTTVFTERCVADLAVAVIREMTGASTPEELEALLRATGEGL
ncbi:amino acid adenylation domain-containing protein [Streptomyces solicathayae]|uniref:Amino acid adenylation domain-containing protein n=1 Tax=Streptomyces solicathayae TaxID=3081768 RepID=A0ABZ0M2J9_9ACTN|nr:amino acid adenylation domain-containing protein [Streptomyces sp. HUAS YS2]WOX26004.1 amino acid adenylation domain-containing protein [Streptomyces sp. HUAS YS2]